MVFLILLYAVSAISALVYGVHFVHFATGHKRTICKALTFGPLCLASVWAGGPLALTVALGFGALGDVFLARDGARNFLAGLVAFLLGHISYIWLLAGIGAPFSTIAGTPWRVILAGVLIVGALVILRRLSPHLGAMRGPVMAYACVIIAMGLVALTVPLGWPLGLALPGAVLFIASDAILGFDLFGPKIAESRARKRATLLWFLYCGGQALLFAATV